MKYSDNMDEEIKFNIEETRNLAECITWVKSHMCSGPNGDEDFFVWLNLPEDNAIVNIHHGYGTFIRNTLKLWDDGPAVKWFNSQGIYHADDMSSIIFTSLHRNENKKSIDLEKQIKRYRDHWEKYDKKVNDGKYK